MMYAKRNIRKKREQNADILDMYWKEAMSTDFIGKHYGITAASVAKLVQAYWNSKTPEEQKELHTRRVAKRKSLVK